MKKILSKVDSYKLIVDSWKFSKLEKNLFILSKILYRRDLKNRNTYKIKKRIKKIFKNE